MSDEGASPRELILEACRRNNTSLLDEVLKNLKPSGTQKTQEDAISDLLNNARDGMGNAALHVAASAGSYEVIDLILDQPQVETDPLCRQAAETPLHKAVQYTNSLSPPDWSAGQAVVEILVDAGCDPRLRNKGKSKPVEQVDPRNAPLRDFLRRAEVLMQAGDDVVNEDEDGADRGAGSESD